MTVNYDEEIKQKYDEINSNMEQLEKLKNEFLQVATNYFGFWYEKNARQLIIENEEKVKLFDTTAIKAIKDDVRVLTENANKYVIKYFNDTFWWHTNNFNNLGSSSARNLPPEVSDVLKIIAGELGDLFEGHGLNLSGSGGITGKLKFFKHNQKPTSYGHTMENVSNLIKAYYDYYLIAVETENLRANIVKLNEDKKKNSISDLWDSL